MIPQSVLTYWRANHAPWSGDEQVEQDLIISRALVEMYSDELIADSLAFRGGTALNKLFLPTMSRYSEDIDLVQVRAEAIGQVMTRLRAALKWLGTPQYKQAKEMVTLYYSYSTEPPLEKRMRLKIEINVVERFTVFGYEHRPLEIKSEWFSGKASVRSFTLEELLSTKLRALYQRKKGRDLFDPWMCKNLLEVDQNKVVTGFVEYMKHKDQKVSRAEFERHLFKKLQDAAFREDIHPLLREGVEYDFDSAARFMLDEVVSKLPGPPWKKDGST
ncbi:MAG TPA: nucleotidyl transferase AbiEii/AbiGii toxin family protein [Oculatellaceae cyanobacterium]